MDGKDRVAWAGVVTEKHLSRTHVVLHRQTRTRDSEANARTRDVELHAHAFSENKWTAARCTSRPDLKSECIGLKLHPLIPRWDILVAIGHWDTGLQSNAESSSGVCLTRTGGGLSR